MTQKKYYNNGTVNTLDNTSKKKTFYIEKKILSNTFFYILVLFRGTLVSLFWIVLLHRKWTCALTFELSQTHLIH